MHDLQAQLDRSIARITGALDRESPLALSVQLHGALKFGIALGDLPAGMRMPSVRELARRLGISPVTVTQIYAALQAEGMLESRPGRGTFVRDAVRHGEADGLRDLDRQLAALIRSGRRHGLSPHELAARIGLMAQAPARALHLLMLGNFRITTESYAADLRPHLSAGDRLTVTTVTELSHAPPPRDIDLVLAPVTLLQQAQQLFPHCDCLGLTLIPDAATRIALAGLGPDARVVALSFFADFIPSMRAGIMRFAPHVSHLTMVARGAPGMEAALAQADVVVWSSGNEAPLTAPRPGQTSFEYRHTPDGNAVRNSLLPMLETLRARPIPDKEAAR